MIIDLAEVGPLVEVIQAVVCRLGMAPRELRDVAMLTRLPRRAIPRAAPPPRRAVESAHASLAERVRSAEQSLGDRARDIELAAADAKEPSQPRPLCCTRGDGSGPMALGTFGWPRSWLWSHQAKRGGPWLGHGGVAALGCAQCSGTLLK